MDDSHRPDLARKLEAARNNLSDLLKAKGDQQFYLTKKQYDDFMWAKNLLKTPTVQIYNTECDCDEEEEEGGEETAEEDEDCSDECGKPVPIDGNIMKKLCKIHQQLGEVLKEMRGGKSDQDEDVTCEMTEETDENSPTISATGSEQESEKTATSTHNSDTSDPDNKTIAIKIQRVPKEDLKNFQNNSNDGKIHIPLCSGCFDQSKVHVKVEGSPAKVQINKPDGDKKKGEKTIYSMDAGKDDQGNDIRIMVKECEPRKIKKSNSAGQGEASKSNLKQKKHMCKKCRSLAPQMGVLLDTESLDKSEISFQEGICAVPTGPAKLVRTKRTCSFNTCPKRNPQKKLAPIREKSNNNNNHEDCCPECCCNSDSFCFRSDISTDIADGDQGNMAEDIELIHEESYGEKKIKVERFIQAEPENEEPCCACLDQVEDEEPICPCMDQEILDDMGDICCPCPSLEDVCICERPRLCSSMELDVSDEYSRLREKGIHHQNEAVRLELQDMGVDRILQACRPSKCCRKAILDERQKTGLPYVVSLKSLPLVAEDVKVIKDSFKRSVDKPKKKDARDKLSYYVDLGKNDLRPPNCPWVVPVYSVKYGMPARKTYVLKKPSREQLKKKSVCIPHKDLDRKSSTRTYILRKPKIVKPTTHCVTFKDKTKKLKIKKSMMRSTLNLQKNRQEEVTKKKKSRKSETDLQITDSICSLQHQQQKSVKHKKKKRKELKLRSSIGSYDIGDSSSLDKKADYYFSKLRHMQSFCNREKYQISFSKKDIVMEKSTTVCHQKYQNKYDIMNYFLELVNDKLMFTLQPPQYQTYSAHYSASSMHTKDSNRSRYKVDPDPKWSRKSSPKRKKTLNNMSSEEIIRKENAGMVGTVYSATATDASSTSTSRTGSVADSMDSRKSLGEAPWAPFIVSDVSLPRPSEEVVRAEPAKKPAKNVCQTKEVCQRSACRVVPSPPLPEPTPKTYVSPTRKRSSQGKGCNLSTCKSKTCHHKTGGKKPKYLKIEIQRKKHNHHHHHHHNRDPSACKKSTTGGSKEICELYKNQTLMAGSSSKKCQECVEKVFSCPQDVEILIVDKKIKIVQQPKKNKKVNSQ